MSTEEAASKVRNTRRWLSPFWTNACHAIFNATSTAVEPLSLKNTRVRPGGDTSTSRSASVTAGSWVAPAKSTWSSRAACSESAATSSGRP